MDSGEVSHAAGVAFNDMWRVFLVKLTKVAENVQLYIKY